MEPAAAPALSFNKRRRMENELKKDRSAGCDDQCDVNSVGRDDKE